MSEAGKAMLEGTGEPSRGWSDVFEAIDGRSSGCWSGGGVGGVTYEEDTESNHRCCVCVCVVCVCTCVCLYVCLYVCAWVDHKTTAPQVVTEVHHCTYEPHNQTMKNDLVQTVCACTKYPPVLGDMVKQWVFSIHLYTRSTVSVSGSSMVTRSVVVVVSPLVSLMVDLVTSLRLSDISAVSTTRMATSHILGLCDILCME